MVPDTFGRLEWDGDADEMISLLQQAGYVDANRRFLNVQEMFAANEKRIRWMWEE